MFHDPDRFSFTATLKRKAGTVRDELSRLNAPLISLHRDCTNEEFKDKLAGRENGWTPSWQVGSSEPNYAWLTYALAYEGQFPADVVNKLPATKELLSHPAFHVCAFSKLLPLSVIGPHSHPELGGTKLTLHLGLDVEPHRCFLAVNGEFREEISGEILVFDGSNEHFALNVGERDRTVLYIEFDSAKT